jgi:NtrC-family two-component system response regulator AlgB
MQTLFEGRIARFRVLANGSAAIVLTPVIDEKPTTNPAQSLEEVETTHIKWVLSQSKTLEDAARTLGINLSTLWRKRKAYGLM